MLNETVPAFLLLSDFCSCINFKVLNGHYQWVFLYHVNIMTLSVAGTHPITVLTHGVMSVGPVTVPLPVQLQSGPGNVYIM